MQNDLSSSSVEWCAARLNDVELSDAILASIEKEFGYPPPYDELSFHDRVVFMVGDWSSWAAEVGVKNTVGPDSIYEFDRLAEAYEAIGSPEFASLCRQIQECIENDRVRYTDEEEPSVEEFVGLSMTVDEMTSLVRRDEEIVSGLLANYIRRNLGRFSHRDLRAFVRKGPYVPPNVGYLASLFHNGDSYARSKSLSELPGIAQIQRYASHEGIKELNPKDYRVVNTSIGSEPSGAWRDETYIRYLRPINGVLYEVTLGGEIRARPNPNTNRGQA